MADAERIKHMVDRFLGWKLPENFNPDAGISFKATFNEHTAHPMKHEPFGTNLFDATQADAMVRYMVEGISPGSLDVSAGKIAVSYDRKLPDSRNRDREQRGLARTEGSARRLRRDPAREGIGD